MNKDIQAYNNRQSKAEKEICNLLAKEISKNLPDAENKIWHAHPVWFLDGNPIAGYSKLKDSIRLLFWSGQGFGEKALRPEGSFKASEIRYTSREQINIADLKKWLKKATTIQYDYKNIVKRKGVLLKLDLPKKERNQKPSPYGSVRFTSVDEYNASFEKDIQKKLQQLRTAILQSAPLSEETISYNMPAFKQKRILVYYMAHKHHIGFYPTPSPIRFFKEDLKNYKTSKGAIQFPIDKALPLSLIKKIVRFRLTEEKERLLTEKRRS